MPGYVSGFFFEFGDSPEHIIVNHNTAFITGKIFHGNGIGDTINYLTFTNDVLQINNEYGITAPDAAEGVRTLETHYPNRVFRRNIIAGIERLRDGYGGVEPNCVNPTTKLGCYPADNYYPQHGDFDSQFVNRAGGDYRLAATSVGKNAGTDDRDVGYIANPFNASQQARNIINVQTFFVRQHYRDLLRRTPNEESEVNLWANVLTHPDCSPSFTGACYDRLYFSGIAIFDSMEFINRGYFTYLFYPVAYGATQPRPFYSNFTLDMDFMSDTSATRKQAFADAFVERPQFKQIYDYYPTPTGYVDKLLQQINLPNHPQRAAWIDALTQNTKTRAQVLRELVESPEVFAQQQNRARVALHYLGYLLRDPDTGGYNDWLYKLDNNLITLRQMTHGFINSIEYRARFDQPQ